MIHSRFGIYLSTESIYDWSSSSRTRTLIQLYDHPPKVSLRNRHSILMRVRLRTTVLWKICVIHIFGYRDDDMIMT
jgi:hypothetical protein